MPSSLPPVLALVLSAAMLTGCGAQRTITITSEPSGALVHLNDEEVGRTPVTVPFTFYGVYDVRLEADGHAPLWTSARASAPLWEHPGPDLVGELVGAHSRVAWHFELEPATAPEEVDPDQLVDRARQLRARTWRE